MNKKVIQAGKFKAICLKLMDEVKETGMEVIITKRQIPIVKLSPVLEKETRLFGKMKGTVQIKRDIIKPIEEKWNADS